MLKVHSLCVHAQLFSCVWLFAILWTVAHQSPLSMGFSRQEYWSGLSCPPPGDLPNPGIEPTCLFHLLHWQGGDFTTSTPWEAPLRTDAELNLRDRVVGDVEKNSFIALPGKGGQIGLLPLKPKCLNWEDLMRNFIAKIQRWGCKRLGCVQGLYFFNLVSGNLLMSFSGSFNVASGGLSLVWRMVTS